jgi:hypothetical protein
MKLSTDISSKLNSTARPAKRPCGPQRRAPGAIYALAMDDHHIVCLTESCLDTWWASLAPSEKADLYERELDRDTAVLDRAPQPNTPNTPSLATMRRSKAVMDEMGVVLRQAVALSLSTQQEVPRG